MLAFEILVNGSRLCVVGTASSDVVSTIVTWARRRPDTINFHVGGIVSDGSRDDMDWKTPTIGVGDEVVIRLFESDICDEPDERRQSLDRRD